MELRVDFTTTTRMSESTPSFKFQIKQPPIAGTFSENNYCVSDGTGSCVAFDVYVDATSCATCATNNCATTADLKAGFTLTASTNRIKCSANPLFATSALAAADNTVKEYTCDLSGLILDDDIVENDECLTLTLADVRVGAASQTFAVQNSKTFDATITGSELSAMMLIRFPAGDKVNEASSAAFTFEVTLSHTNAAEFKGILVGSANTPTGLQSALPGQDFTEKSAPFTFAPGEGKTGKTVTLAIINDAVQELTETFTVQATRDNTDLYHQQYGSSSVLTATILDDENVKVSVVSKSQGGAPAFKETTTADEIWVRLSTGLSFGDQVTLQSITLTEGTAKTPADYVYTAPAGGAKVLSCSASGTQTCPEDTTTYKFPITIVDDQLIELAETFLVTVKGPGATASFRATDAAQNAVMDKIVPADIVTTFTINSDDDATLSISNPTQAEGNVPGAPPGPNNLVFTVTLSHNAETDLNFVIDHAAGRGNAALNEDFTFTRHLVTFPSGQKVQTVSVPVVNDDIQEATETFQLFRDVAASGTPTTRIEARVTNAAGTAQGVGTITDDEKATVVVSDAKVITSTEINTFIMKFAVTLSHSFDTALTVDWKPATGTATTPLPGTPGDFTWPGYSSLSPAPVTIAAGNTRAELPVDIINDAVEEATETFTVKLNSIAGAAGRAGPTISRDTAVGTVEELSTGESATLGFEQSSITVKEGADAKASLVVTLSHQLSSNLQVTWSTVDGTATSTGAVELQDFEAKVAVPLTFEANGAVPLKKTIEIPIRDDTIVEGKETFAVKLTVMDADRFQTVQFAGSKDTATVTIEPDTDTATVSFEEFAYANEQDQFINFKVKLSHRVEQVTRVQCSTSSLSSILGVAKEWRIGAALTIDKNKCEGDNHFDYREPKIVRPSNDGDGVTAPVNKVFFVQPLDLSADVKIELVNDNCQEATESFTITLDRADAFAGEAELDGNRLSVRIDAAKNKATGFITDNENAQVTLATEYMSSTEGDGTLRLNVGLTHPVDFDVKVDFAFDEEGLPHPATVECAANNMACQQDFKVVFPRTTEAKQKGSIKFPRTTQVQALALRVEDDTVVEPNEEQVKLTLTAYEGALISTKYPTGVTHFTLTFKDNDQGEVFVADTSAFEVAGGKMEFQLSLSHQVQTDVTVSYSSAADCTAATCAVAGRDYVAVGTPVSATIAKYAFSAPVSVLLTDDQIQECDETFKVQINTLSGDWSAWGKTGGPGLKIGKAGTGTIMDAEPGFKFENTRAEAKEGQGSVRWAITLSHALSTDVSLQWSTVAVPAPTDPTVAKQGERYADTVSSPATELKFTANQKAAQTSPSAAVINDVVFSPDQSFQVSLMQPAGICAGLLKELPKLEGVVSDDEQATITVKGTLEEGKEGDVSVVLSHSVKDKWPGAMTVDWVYLYDASTDAREIDFTGATTGKVKFDATSGLEVKAKQTPKTDGLVENEEKFNLVFTPEKAYSKLTANTQVLPTIKANEKGTLTITVNREFKETDLVYAFDVKLDKATGTKFSAAVVCDPVDGVTFASDFAAVHFVGETGETKTVRIPFQNDNVVEFKKDFSGFPCKLNVEEKYKNVLQVVYPGAAGAPNWNIKVEDEDVASLTGSSVDAKEGDKVKFTLKLSNPVDTDVKISVFTKDGTAKSPADFDAIAEAAPKELTIAKGQTEVSHEVQTKGNDALLEGDQTFMLVVKSVQAADRKVNILTKETVGTIKDTDKGVLTLSKKSKASVKEGEALSFEVKIQDATTKADLKTENAVAFAYTVDAGPLDRTPSTAKSAPAAYCFDFLIDHCDGQKLSEAKVKAGPLQGFVKAGTALGSVDILTIKDGEVDYTNEVKFAVTAVLQTDGVVTLDTNAASLKWASTIEDIDKEVPHDLTVPVNADVTEGKLFDVTVQINPPYRRDVTIYLSSAAPELIAGLDFPDWSQAPVQMPGGKKSHAFQYTVPDNHMVLQNDVFDVTLHDVEKKKRNTVTYNRIDPNVPTIEADMVRSVVTNTAGGSGLSVVYRLVLSIRGKRATPGLYDFTLLSGYEDQPEDHLKVTYEMKVQDFTINGRTYKALNYVAAGVRTLWFDKSGVVETAVTDTKFVTRGFPVTLTLKPDVPSPKYVPELCRAPLTSGPVVGDHKVHVYLSPGEANTFWPGTCFYYPPGTDTSFWNTQVRATAGGPEFKLTNPYDTKMHVNVKVEEAKKRTVINLADQGDAPITLRLWDQVDYDVVVADKLFLFECNRPGKQCCNTVQGEGIIRKCNVDERVFRDAPVWAEDYDYDVSGIVRVSLQALVPGLSRQCFGFAPAQHLYPDGFCLNVYVPEPPIVAYIPSQTVVQGDRVTTWVDVLSGTVLGNDTKDRSSGYNARVECLKGCDSAKAWLQEKGGRWSLTIQGHDVNYGDSQFVVIASDQYYGATSQPIDVRTIRAATFDGFGQCQ